MNLSNLISSVTSAFNLGPSPAAQKQATKAQGPSASIPAQPQKPANAHSPVGTTLAQKENTADANATKAQLNKALESVASLLAKLGVPNAQSEVLKFLQSISQLIPNQAQAKTEAPAQATTNDKANDQPADASLELIQQMLQDPKIKQALGQELIPAPQNTSTPQQESAPAQVAA